jgi:hypothetical protein
MTGSTLVLPVVTAGVPVLSASVLIGVKRHADTLKIVIPDEDSQALRLIKQVMLIKTTAISIWHTEDVLRRYVVIPLLLDNRPDPCAAIPKRFGGTRIFRTSAIREPLKTKISFEGPSCFKNNTFTNQHVIASISAETDFPDVFSGFLEVPTSYTYSFVIPASVNAH